MHNFISSCIKAPCMLSEMWPPCKWHMPPLKSTFTLIYPCFFVWGRHHFKAQGCHKSVNREILNLNKLQSIQRVLLINVELLSWCFRTCLAYRACISANLSIFDFEYYTYFMMLDMMFHSNQTFKQMCEVIYF